MAFPFVPPAVPLLLAAAVACALPAAPAQPTGRSQVVHHAADSPPGAPAASDDSRLRLRTERVAVFKDGHALVLKTAEAVADSRGRVFTDQVPDSAVLGCFWATTAEGQIAAMRAELVTDQREESNEAVCLTMAELLRANADGEVTLTLRDPAQTRLTARIVRLLEAPPAATDPAAPGARPTVPKVETVRTPLAPSGGQYVLLRIGDTQTVLPVDHIHSLAAGNLRTTTTHAQRVQHTRKRLGFELGEAAAGRPVALRIMYFTPGFRWIPTYRLSINPDNRSGVLALQGELLNECEDFDPDEAVALDMVVGVPNFRFRGTVSPLVMESTLRNALLAAAPDLMGSGNPYANAMFAQRAGEWRDHRAGGAASAAGADLAPELAAGGEQDLFVYSAPRLALKRGERASVPLLRQEVAFDHVYTLDIAAVRDPRRSGAAQYLCGAPGGPPASPADQRPSSRIDISHVWHQLELRNSSAAPWTTGAALVMGPGVRGREIPIAQDLLRYTPPGGKVLLPLTVAVDLRGELVEEEIGREENALYRNGTHFALVRSRATITLTSSRNQTSAMRVSLSLGGRAGTVSGGGRALISGHSSADWGNNDPGPVNNHSDVTWEIPLAAGESRDLVVEFTYYTY